MLSCLPASVSAFALHKVSGRVKCMNALRKRNPLNHWSIHPLLVAAVHAVRGARGGQAHLTGRWR